MQMTPMTKRDPGQRCHMDQLRLPATASLPHPGNYETFKYVCMMLRGEDQTYTNAGLREGTDV